MGQTDCAWGHRAQEGGKLLGKHYIFFSYFGGRNDNAVIVNSKLTETEKI